MSWGTQEQTCPCKNHENPWFNLLPRLQQPNSLYYPIDLTLFCRAINSADRLATCWSKHWFSPFFFLLVWAWLCRRAASFPACESAITKHMYVRDLSNKAAWKIIGMEIKCQHLLQDEPHPSWQSSDPQFDKREEVAPNFFVLAMTSLIKNNPGKHLRSNTCAHIHLDFPSHCSAFYQKDFLSTT